jgi:hypothetical protein
MPGLFAYGMAFGTVAVRKGFSLIDAVIMSGTGYAGVAQLIVLESWPQRLTVPAIAATAAVTALISSRFLLIGASLRPWLGSQPSAKIYPALFLLTELNWLMSMRYRANGGSDPAYFLGGGAVIYCVWEVSTAAGFWQFDRRSAYLRYRPGVAGVLCRHAGVDVARHARLDWLDYRRRGRGHHLLSVRRHVAPDCWRARRFGGGRLDR